MNKKKLLYTSLTALALASFQAKTLAEEVEANVESTQTSQTFDDTQVETSADGVNTTVADEEEAGAEDIAITENKVLSEEPQVQSQIWLALGEDNDESDKEGLKEIFGAQDVPTENIIIVDESIHNKWIPNGNVAKQLTSAFVEFNASGSGVTVEMLTPNTIELTADAYRQAAEKSGIKDVTIKVAYDDLIPLSKATGTSALAGVYEIFEKVTGVTPDSEAGQEILSDALKNPSKYSIDTISKSVMTDTPTQSSEETKPAEPEVVTEIKPATSETTPKPVEITTEPVTTEETPKNESISKLTAATPAEETRKADKIQAQATAEKVSGSVLAPKSSVAGASQAVSNSSASTTPKLPSTGEAVSLVGLLGAGMTATGIVGLKRRQK